MFQIIQKTILNENIRMIEIEAPNIAKNAKPGQFVILRIKENHERLPFTIFDHSENSISIVYQIVGSGTKFMDELNRGDYILDVVGPLGTPTNINNITKAIVVSGGVGCAVAFPLIKALKLNKVDVTTVVGFRSKDLVILEDNFNDYSDKLYITTDDGSYKNKGLVTDVLKSLLDTGTYDVVFTIGPLIMMKFVSLLTKKYNTKTVCSLNPIMIDGTGMCGGCRVSINGETKFACVDGPDFDAHQVNFDLLIQRNNAYKEIERHKYEDTCNLFKGDQHEKN